MPVDDAEILFASQALLKRLAPGDLDATLESITRSAVEVLPQVQYASITIRHHDGTLDSYALTDDLLADLDEQQYQLQEGPCYDATTEESYAVASDLGHDERYPNYGPVAVQAGIRSQAGIRLFQNTRSAGGLNVYSRQVGGLDDAQTMSRLFSHQAAVALAYSIEVKTLREAVQTRTRIGQAVGIVMERYKMPEQQAFAFLTRLSQTRNVKVRHIADQIIAAITAEPNDPPTLARPSKRPLRS
jgi:GAF domain-containing protein